MKTPKQQFIKDLVTLVTGAVIIGILLGMIISGCDSSTNKMITGGVDQHVENDCNGLSTSPSCYVTYVWYAQNIQWASYLNIEASQHQIDSVKTKADSNIHPIK